MPVRKEELKSKVSKQAATKQEPEQEASAPKKAVITAPNSNYCGKIGGVGFVSGKAELEVTDENMRMLHWFNDNGYEVSYV